jgi:gliding motility-associated-like protein
MPAVLRLFFAFTLCVVVANTHAQNYIFAQLTGSPVSTTGWNLQGGARVQNLSRIDNSEILVCPQANGISGAIFYNQPINLSLCKKWKAEFEFRMHDGTGADGMAFCFLDLPPVGFVTGAGLGIPATANGLKVCFDNWNNCIDFNPGTVHKDMPKIEIRYGIGYQECIGSATRDNADGSISFIADSSYKRARITYDDGKIDVYVNDVLYLSDNQKFDYAGYLGFTASTGGYNDNHSIRNVVIYTEMPPSNAGITATVCPNTPVQLGAAANADYVYQWSPATGLNNANISNPVATANNITSTTQTLLYTVRTSFKINPGCSSTDSVDVKILPRPRVNFKMPDICLNDAQAAFTDSSYSGEPLLLPFKYFWKFGDSSAGISNPDTSVLINPLHKYSAAANYHVSLRVTNNAGCIDSLKKVFTVNGATPKAGFNVLNATALCSNIGVKIQDASSVDFGRITKVNIDWGDGTGAENDIETAAAKIYSHLFPVNRTANPKIYNIHYTVYSGITCVDQVSKSITVNAAPHVVFGNIPSLCTNGNVYQVTQATETTGLPGSFVYSGSVITTSGIIDPAFGEGSFDIKAIFIASNGCVDTAVSPVIIYPFPVADAGSDLFVLEGGNITLGATASGTLLRYQWTPSSFLNSSTILNPVATPPVDITYQLLVTGQGECSNSDTAHITVLKNPNIPTAFSPNGDGINDAWNIRYLNTYPGCVIQVFDRFGNQVFYSAGYEKPWNGRLNGRPVPVGVYYYIINTKKHDRPFTGSVTVVR